MLRWGILGTGFISNTVADAIKASDGSRIEAVAGRNEKALTGFQSAHKIPRQIVGYDTIVADPDIDVIYIGLPNHVHHTLTMKASDNGKAVLSEKSLTTTMEEARVLVNKVQQNQTFFVEGLMYLAHPFCRKLHSVLTDGRLGALKSVNGFYAADIWKLVNPLGNGTLYNLGCYPVSLLQFVVQTLCGEAAFSARKMQGFGNISKHDGNICDAAVTVRFDDGVLANLQSTDSYGKAFGFSICGENGMLTFTSSPWMPEPGRSVFTWLPYGGEAEEVFIEDEHNAFYHQIKMVEAALTEGRTEALRPSPRLQDSLEVMSFLTEWEHLCKS
ncbi:MAG: Gfo/Idh/MocA family protein [Hyphomicrobiales bacterium]